MNIILFLIITALSLSAQVIQPTPEKLAEMDKWILSYMADNNIPGGLIAVASKGEILHSQSYGLANVELSVPVTDSTVFEIGSISKQFVSAAVMLMVEEGKLNLDDPIHKFLPELPGEWLGVTVEQLMTHTSGIPDYEEIGTYDVYRFRMTPEEVIKIANSRPMDFTPGTGWYYSNTGYYILSMIVERVDGRPLGQVLKTRIFDPLEMYQTQLADPESIILHRAEGYWVNKKGELINRNATETTSTLGAGGLLSSAYDMVKWDAALYGDELLSTESKALMWKPVALLDGEEVDYGFGWFLSPYKGLKSQSHGGQVAGFVANFARYPDEEISIIVFLNRYRVSSRLVKNAVLHTFIPGLGPLPER